MGYNVAVLNRESEWVHHEVHEDVYLYIRQMESYINRPKNSRFLEVYSERFPDRYKYEQLKEEYR